MNAENLKSQGKYKTNTQFLSEIGFYSNILKTYDGAQEIGKICLNELFPESYHHTENFLSQPKKVIFYFRERIFDKTASTQICQK